MEDTKALKEKKINHDREIMIKEMIETFKCEVTDLAEFGVVPGETKSLTIEEG